MLHKQPTGNTAYKDKYMFKCFDYYDHMFSLIEIRNTVRRLKKNNTSESNVQNKRIKINKNTYSSKKGNLTGLDKYSSMLRHNIIGKIVASELMPTMRNTTKIIQAYQPHNSIYSTWSSDRTSISRRVSRAERVHHQNSINVVKNSSNKNARLRQNWYSNSSHPEIQRYYRYRVDRKNLFYSKARLFMSYRG